MAGGEPLGVQPDVIHGPTWTGTGLKGLAATPPGPLRRRRAIPGVGVVVNRIVIDRCILIRPDRFIRGAIPVGGWSRLDPGRLLHPSLHAPLDPIADILHKIFQSGTLALHLIPPACDSSC